MQNIYNGSLTREQFLFYETRITAQLVCQDLPRDEIIERIKSENLFQFPTEKMVVSIARTCFRRLDALASDALVQFLFLLREQNDSVAGWSDSTVSKIRQVLIRILTECRYLDSIRASQLNWISIEPELEDKIRAQHDMAALPAFNCFR